LRPDAAGDRRRSRPVTPRTARGARSELADRRPARRLERGNPVAASPHLDIYSRKSTTMCGVRSIPRQRRASACPGTHEIHFPAAELFHRRSGKPADHAGIAPREISQPAISTAILHIDANWMSAVPAPSRARPVLTPAAALLRDAKQLLKQAEALIRLLPRSATRSAVNIVVGSRRWRHRHAELRSPPRPILRLGSVPREPSGSLLHSCAMPRPRWRSPTICRSARCEFPAAGHLAAVRAVWRLACIGTRTHVKLAQLAALPMVLLDCR